MLTVFKIIRSIFSKKKIQFLGRVGMIFTEEGNRYYIDSELLVPGKYDVAIFKNNIYKLAGDDKIDLDKNEKEIIFERLLIELDRIALRPMIL